MKLLSRFEHGIERLMEGTSGSLFRQQLQPAEIGRKLERMMLTKKRASVGTSLVPNHFVVRLHPKDYVHFSEYSQGLARQMEAWLAQVATQRNLSVIDRITVRIEEDPRAGRRSPGIDATIRDSRTATPVGRRPSVPMPAEPTAAYRAVSAPKRIGMLLEMTEGVLEGETISLTEGSTTIGRAPDNVIVLDAADVSRRHARFELDRGRLRVYDLNSTNGTRVNGDPVRVSDIEDGDEILIGGQRMVLSVRARGRSDRRGDR